MSSTTSIQTDTAEICISVKNLRVTLYGGSIKLLTALIKGKNGSSHFIFGENGTGKTISLRSLAKLVGFPIEPIHSVDFVDMESDIELKGFEPESSRSAYVHQNPLDNFDNSSIADNIRAFLHLRHGSYQDAGEPLIELLASALGLTSVDLLRKPAEFSSGQLQFMAVAIRTFSAPTFTFLDEPFSRLSDRSRRRLAAHIDEISGSTFVVTALLPTEKDIVADVIMKDESHEYEVLRDGDRISIATFESEEAIPNSILLSGIKGSEIFGQAAIEELERVDDTTYLPENGLAFFCGGEVIERLSGVVTLFAGDDGVLTTNVKIHAGINVVAGDNGSGKTLVCHMLTGHLWQRSTWKQVINKLFNLKNLEYKYQDNRSVRGSDRFYIPPEPVLLSEPTIAGEIEHMGADGAAAVSRVCIESGIPVDTDVTSLPYSFQKFIQLCLVPDRAQLVALDEVFGSLSKYLVRHAADYILKKSRSGYWSSCIITSNRPKRTLQILLEAERRLVDDQ